MNLYDLSKKEKTYSICYLQINNFNTERFLKTTECSQIEINKSATINAPDEFVDTETTIYNTEVVSIDQKGLATTYTCTDCSKKGMPDQEDLVNCTCGRMSVKDFCIVSGIEQWKID